MTYHGVGPTFARFRRPVVEYGAVGFIFGVRFPPTTSEESLS
jgi:hypothetical protein